MMRPMRAQSWLLSLLLLTLGCDGRPGPADGSLALDAGHARSDAGPRDGGTDAGAMDAGAADAGAVDAGAVDAGAADGGTRDGGHAWVVPDAGSDAGSEPDAGSDAGSDPSADAGTDAGVPPRSDHHVHIYVSNTCDMTVTPTEVTIPADQTAYFDWHNHSADYPVTVWMSYGGGYTDLPTGATWDEPIGHCSTPLAHDEWADISTACSSFRFLIHCN